MNDIKCYLRVIIKTIIIIINMIDLSHSKDILRVLRLL